MLLLETAERTARIQQRAIAEARRQNLERALAAVGGPLLVVLACCAVIDLVGVPFVVGLVVGLAALAAAAGLWRSSASLCLAGLEASVVVSPPARSRLESVLDSLAVAGGIDRPAVVVVCGAAPNALCLEGGGRGVLVCTTGLLEQLDRIELEAVLGHELSHLRLGDALLASVLGAFYGRCLRLGQVVALLARPEREVRADLAALRMTRYPPGLIAALEAASADPGVPGAGLDALELPAQVRRATAPFWFVPLGAPRSSRAAASRSTVRRGELGVPERIELLAEL